MCVFITFTLPRDVLLYFSSAVSLGCVLALISRIQLRTARTRAQRHTSSSTSVARTVAAFKYLHLLYMWSMPSWTYNICIFYARYKKTKKRIAAAGVQNEPFIFSYFCPGWRSVASGACPYLIMSFTHSKNAYLLLFFAIKLFHLLMPYSLLTPPHSPTSPQFPAPLLYQLRKSSSSLSAKSLKSMYNKPNLWFYK